jgi:hypothetical protein
MQNIVINAEQFTTFSIRSLRVWRSLGVDELERFLMLNMVSDLGPWTATSLAVASGYPATTVKHRLYKRAKQGVCAKTASGWIPTPTGLNGARRIFNEISAVVSGKQAYLSEELIARCLSINASQCDPDAARIITFCPIKYGEKQHAKSD